MRRVLHHDKRVAYTTLAAGQAMIGRGVSGLALRLTDPDRAGDIAKRLASSVATV